MHGNCIKKVIVCITNNVVSDSRVKRQINALADQFESVHVIAMSSPSSDFGIERRNVTHSFANSVYDFYRPISFFRKHLKRWGLFQEMLDIAPVLEYCSFKMKENYYTAKYNYLASSGRYAEIRNRKASNETGAQAIGYILAFFYTSISMALEAEKYEADAIICNDADTLLAGVVHKKARGTRLIYDLHDLRADLSEELFPLMYSEQTVLFENHFIRYADAVMGATKSLLEWAQLHYEISVPIIPIYNCGNNTNVLIENKEYTNKDKLVLYYHGYAYKVRKLELLINAVAPLDHVEAVIRSEANDYIEELKKMAADLKIENKVHFVDLVSTDQVYQAANRDGDIGVYLTDPSACINWRCAFTNKFLEYLTAGLPVITSDTREQAEVVSKYDCGWVLKDLTVEGLQNLIMEIARQKEQLSAKSRNAAETGRNVFCWDIYKKKLIDLVSGDCDAEEGFYNNANVNVADLWKTQELSIQKTVNSIKHLPYFLKGHLLNCADVKGKEK